MRKLLFVVAGIVFPAILCAQIANPNADLVPQTPQSAALFKYNETPVSYYNGTINTSIPVYEISLGKFRLPISLSYHSGGIKVNDEASWVGLGWALNAGGLISEVVMGTRDEYELGHTVDYMKHNIVPNYPLGRDGTPMNVIERGLCFPDINGNIHNYAFSVNNSPLSTAYLASSNREYDLYMYSFNGYSGKMINPRLNYYDNKFISLDNNNIRFTLGSNSFPSDELRAVTPDGATYVFNNTETTQSYDAANSPVLRYNKHLSSIITPDGRTINFTYKTVNVIEIPPASQSYYTRMAPNQPAAWYSSKTIAKTALVQMLFLDQISWDNGVIKFISDNVREDMAGGSKLNSIEVYNSDNRLVKKADFSYDYFIGDIKYGDYFTQGEFEQPGSLSAWPSITEDIRKKRLKLLSVKIDDMPPYTFTYNSGEMPYKTALAKDMWNYFNGVNFNMVPWDGPNPAPRYSLLPNPASLGYYDASIAPWVRSLPGIRFGQRETNSTAMQMAVLTSIQYPTGGHTDFEYEPNRFTSPDGVSYNVNLHGYDRAMDGNVTNDIKTVEFVVPTVNAGMLYNSGRFDIRLFCGDCKDAMNNSACRTYTSSSSNRELYGLFITLERFNGTSWDMLKVWDLSDPDIISNHGVMSVNYDFLQESRYRITANYPDYCPGDYYGQKVASIQAWYYRQEPTSDPTAIGGGIRIKSVTDYEKPGHVALKKQFTYEGGTLMTKPVYIRIVQNHPMTYRAKACLSPDPCHNCDVTGSITPVFMPGTNIPVDMHFFAGYYSEPTVPYSYAANGSAVGYTKVTEEYVGAKSNGKTEYVYHNKKDVLLNNDEASYFYVHDYLPNMNVDLSRMPGIPTIKDLLNGSPEFRTVYVKTPTGMDVIEKTSYQYRVDNRKIYWGFKTEYAASGIVAAGSVCGSNPDFLNDYAQCEELANTTVYFLPVSAANVNLISKTDEYYDGASKMTNTTTYTYNTKNQLQQEFITNSKGQQIAKASYFVPDRQTGDPVLTEMQNRNMIDYPVEQVSTNITLNQEQTKKQINYQFWNGVNIILPGSQATSVLGNALHTDVTYNSYDNKGNILQLTGDDGVPISYVWAYKQSYPIAKITGAAYGHVLAALGQSDVNLSYLQNMGDAGLEIELNKLRNNLATAVPKAQVNTFLYIPLVGMKQASDAAGKRSFYEYDAQGRLVVIKDQNGQVVKTYEYKY